MDDFRLIKKLGKGSRGSVYLAENINYENNVLPSLVVIKIIDKQSLPPGTDINTVKDFVIPTLAGCMRNIVCAYRLYDDGDNFYIVSQYHPSSYDATHLLSKNPSDKTLIEIMSILVEALADLHSKNIAHRDIKLSNILIKEVDQAGDGQNVSYQPFIIDFDLSCLLGVPGVLGCTGHPGTPEYAAPEVFQGLNIDPRFSDIYSLGVAFYKLYNQGKKLYGDNNNNLSRRDYSRMSIETKHIPSSGPSPLVNYLIDIMLSKTPYSRPLADVQQLILKQALASIS